MEKHIYKPGNPVALCDTTKLSNEEWLKIREHGMGKDPFDKDWIPFTITGSGASSALGVNPWVSDEEYRDRKMGVVPAIEESFNEESKAAGHVFEPFVGINFMRYMKQNFPEAKVNLIKDCMRDILPYLKDACPDDVTYGAFISSQDEVTQKMQEKWEINPSAMYQCGTTNEDGSLRYPFALANIDGLVDIDGKVGIFEAKTTSTRSHAIRDYWEKGQIPPYYYWQLIFYMAVMNVDFAYITCIWGVTLNDMAVICIERDLELEEQFMDFLASFIEDMQDGLPLEESRSDPDLVARYYTRKFGVVTEAEPLELPAKCREMAEMLIDLEEEEKQLSEELEERLKDVRSKKGAIANKFASIMGGNPYAKIELEDKSVLGIKVKVPMHRAKVDEKAFMEECPDIYKASLETEEKLSWKKAEKLEKGIKKRYTLPAEPDVTKTPSVEVYRYTKKAE